MQPPHGFDVVATAQSKSYGPVSVIAVVVDALRPAPTAGASYMCTFTVKDSDLASEPWRGLKVKYFHERQEHLPAPEEGDVILLRNIKPSIVRGVRMCVSSHVDNVCWSLWRRQGRSAAYLVKNKPGTSGPTAEEKKYALWLLNSGSTQGISRSQQSEASIPRRQHTLSHEATTGLPSRKFCLLKDAAFSSFVDITGQVVKTFMENDKFLLYVTDYTSNKNLFNYTLPTKGDDDHEYRYINAQGSRQWPGPFGTMTIQVTLWDPHASFAREKIKVDDYVSLCNVHLKMDRYSGRMEGALHTDRTYPNKVQVYVINDHDTDAHVRELVERKQAYWRKLRTELPSALGEEEDSTQKLAKERKKRSTPETKQKIEKEKRRTEKHSDQPELSRPVRTTRDELNPHIRASYTAKPCRLIRDILDPDTHTFRGPDGVEFQLPFQNVCYRSSVRVVDFFPHSLEDFSVLYNLDNAIRSPEGGDTSDDGDPDARRKWEWRFCFLVEDGGPNTPPLPRGQTRERMPLFVSGSDAEFLLRMDAVNLHNNPEMLARLREKLFLLWGDLEERKSADIDAFYAGQTDAVSAKPFICCIKEYGVKTRNREAFADSDKEWNPRSLGWERRFQMFHTTIL
ncbi:hypothetical protein MaudMau93_007261 [Microsporum audouinii]